MGVICPLFWGYSVLISGFTSLNISYLDSPDRVHSFRHPTWYVLPTFCQNSLGCVKIFFCILTCFLCYLVVYYPLPHSTHWNHTRTFLWKNDTALSWQGCVNPYCPVNLSNRAVWIETTLWQGGMDWNHPLALIQCDIKSTELIDE